MSTTGKLKLEVASSSIGQANADQLLGATWALMKSLLLAIAFLLIGLKMMGGDLGEYTLGVLILAVFGTWLNYQYKWYVFARYFGFVFSCLGYFLILTRFGAESYAYFLVGPIILAVLWAFETKLERIVLAVIPLTISIGVSLFTSVELFPFISRVESPEDFRIVFILLTMLLSYNITGSFLNVNREFRLRIKAMLERIEEKEEKLQLKCHTEQLQVQELEMTNLKLEAEIQNRIKVERELSSSNEQLEQFSYAASHDLKEPLRSISSFIRLIQRKVQIVEDPEISVHTNSVIESASRMTKLLDDLLEYSRVGKPQRTSSLVDLNLVVKSALHGMRGSLNACNAVVNVHSLPSVFANKKCINSLFSKLIDNSIRNREENRSLVITIAEGEIVDGMVQILVSDNGIGIDLDSREKVLQLFYREQCQTGGSGSGIGLSVCRKMIQSFGGELRFISTGNQEGITCLFTLPASCRRC